MDTIILLYFHLKDETLTDEYQEIIDTIDSKIANQPLKEYMMKEMGHLLPPLQVWDNHIKEFDPWQKNVIQHIKLQFVVFLRVGS